MRKPYGGYLGWQWDAPGNEWACLEINPYIRNEQNCMTYLDQLYPWCIIKPLPNLQRCIVARFRRRNEAEAHLQVIRRLLPHITYMIIFDPMPEREESLENCSVAEPCEENSSIFPDVLTAMPD